MDQELIKAELIKRVKSLEQTKYYNYSSSENVFGQIANRLENVEPFSKDVIKILNTILAEKNIELTEAEKREFTEYIEPTTTELITEFIKEWR